MEISISGISISVSASSHAGSCVGKNSTSDHRISSPPAADLNAGSSAPTKKPRRLGSALAMSTQADSFIFVITTYSTPIGFRRLQGLGEVVMAVILATQVACSPGDFPQKFANNAPAQIEIDLDAAGHTGRLT